MKPNYKLTLFRYITALCLLIITQIVFYLLNSTLFNVNSFKDFLNICFGNLRFALSSLSFYLAPFLLLALLPVPLHGNKVYKVVISVLYFFGVEFIMVANLIDCGYFRFTFKRLTFDIFNYLGVGGDFNSLIPQFLRDYWHIVLIFIALNVVLYITDWLLRKKYCHSTKTSTSFNVVKGIIYFVIITFCGIIFQRGGFQVRPLNLLQASQYAATQNTALVLNTPFTLYRTIGKPALTLKNYYTEEELAGIYSPLQSPSQEIWTDTLFTQVPQTGKTNVVIIIIESYAAEYFSTYNKTNTTYVPFLDSLAKHSIVFNGMSNGKRSIDGIPAIVSSLPLLTEESYITSPYSENNLSSIGGLFSSLGYKTFFFHGGYNGTMNFDSYTNHVGYGEYLGKNEYNDDRDYDGNWGIFDEPFLQYMVKKLNTVKEPFAATVFTLSSHHPYTIPPQHKGRFPKGTLIVHETVGYTDYALRKFFESASKSDWYKNTVFIITADHSALTATKEFQTELGLYKIPILIYSPMLKHGVMTNQTMQQIDILPTVADMLHTECSVFSFGRSVYSALPHYYIYYSNGEYILMMGDYVSKFREGYKTELFNAKTDPDLRNDISDKNKSITDYHEKLTKAIIQQYNNRLIKNQTIIK